MAKSHIVYSTDPDWQETCPVCDFPIESCLCEKDKQRASSARPVSLGKEKKGRGGKTVTTIRDVPGDLKPLLKELQRLCGAGGTVKDRIIEIQGDQVDKIRTYLLEKGIKVKR